MSRSSDPRLSVPTVVAAATLAWFGLAQGLETTESTPRTLLLALPGLGFGLLAFPALSSHWALRVPLALALWAAAFGGATQLYYPVGSAAGACAITGFWAGAILVAVALWRQPQSISRNRAILVASGVLWVLGSAAIGQGVELNLDRPTLQPRPGRWLLAAGVVGWYAPFALLRAAATRRPPADDA